jgi:dTDP-4-amino-4,6-dideoxygalactose transaminase
MPVPFVDIKAQHDAIRDEMQVAIHGVIESGRFVGGPEVEGFEAEFASFCGVNHAVGVGNGTDALQLALRACGVGQGDEVITVAYTFTATPEAIVNVGAKPVFVDVDETYTIDVGHVADRITSRTKAIIPVHLYGQMADMAPLIALAEKNGLHVIEDAAQAHGARYRGQRAGSLGHLACFSFYVAKNLGALGDAGAVVTNNDEWAEKIRSLRDHGRSGHYLHEIVGYNSRLDALQAAVLRVKLRHLDTWNAARRCVAGAYAIQLASSGLWLPKVTAEREHIYHLYVVRSPERDELRQHLEQDGIGTGIHYPIPLHLQPAYRFLGYERGSLPNSEAWAEQVLSLPMYAEMTEHQVEQVVASLNRDWH